MTRRQEAVDELRNDVTRLELIADRFSKVEQTPELDEANIYEELEKARVYMERRAPRKVEFIFPAWTTLNHHQNKQSPFHWVIENLLRNALDAMDGKGTISATIIEHDKHVDIEISDTGKGIPSSDLKQFFSLVLPPKKEVGAWAFLLPKEL
ncbi:MAG: ATP-binding protein [Saprospiraceae bacterium]